MTGPVLITGATGYVGGRLARDLLQHGMVTIGGTRRRSLVESRNASKFPWRWVDPLDPTCDLEAALRGTAAVVHLAAANEWRSAEEPDPAMLETAAGTRRLVAAAVAAGVKTFLFFSTIHAYGAPLCGTLAESTRARPTHPYAITHLAAEAYVDAAIAQKAIDGAVIRLSNAIGAPATMEVDRWTLLGNDMVRQAVSTGRIAVRTPGQWRDFIVMHDVVDCVRRLLENPVRGDDPLFNVGSGQATRVIDMALMIAKSVEMEIGRPIAVTSADDGNAAAAAFRFAVDRMQALGYRPSPPSVLENEIRQTARLIVHG